MLFLAHIRTHLQQGFVGSVPPEQIFLSREEKKPNLARKHFKTRIWLCTIIYEPSKISHSKRSEYKANMQHKHGYW